MFMKIKGGNGIVLDEILEAKNEDPSITLYERALSRAVAMKMAQRGDVTKFRNEHLEGRVLHWKDVGHWIRQHEPPPGVPASFYVSLPVPDEAMRLVQHAAVRGLNDESATVTISVSLRDLVKRGPRPLTLFYLIPGEETPHQAAIQSDTVLDELYWLAGGLSATAAWTEAQAVVFVLANQTPLIRQFTSQIAESVELPALTRITLHLDPRISQRELARHFQWVRHDLVHARHRDISAKHLTLALFSTTTEGRTGSLRDRVDRWNAQHPDWAYQHTTNFSRDTGVALRRLLGTNYDAIPSHTGNKETEEK